MTIAMMAYSAFILWLITMITMVYRVSKAFHDFSLTRLTKRMFTIDSFHFDLEDELEPGLD